MVMVWGSDDYAVFRCHQLFVQGANIDRFETIVIGYQYIESKGMLTQYKHAKDREDCVS